MSAGRFLVQKLVRDEWHHHAHLHDYRDAKVSCERIARGGGRARVIEGAIDPPVVLFGARPDCYGCSHPLHAAYACPERPLFTSRAEPRCGCDVHYNFGH